MKYSKLLFTTVSILAFLIIACTPSTGDKHGIKFQQYYIKGEQLYLTYCSNCHQKDGTGLGLIYPPLNISDFMSDKKAVVCLIKNGQSGKITVNGKTFDNVMPGQPALSDIEIAEITTYIYNAWSFKEGLTEVKEISAFLKNCEK